jgi:hypothetical protein
MPSDPANLEGEWGRSLTDERYRLVLSGVFNLPWSLTLAPIYEYGSGQPWNRILGYDYNGDGHFYDRAQGAARNDQDGPDYQSLSLRISKAISFGQGEIELILESFNLFNTVNYDVQSVDNSMYFAGPTLANPSGEYVPNPRFGEYTATHSPREIQIGMRYVF